jgi:glycine hydroxymethyltransferase
VIGKKAAQALDRAGIICNYNTVPYDPRKPFSPSGVRMGSPAVTSRGMGEGDMTRVAAWIDEVVSNVDDEAAIDRVGAEVREYCRRFPAPGCLLG